MARKLPLILLFTGLILLLSSATVFASLSINNVSTDINFGHRTYFATSVVDNTLLTIEGTTIYRSHPNGTTITSTTLDFGTLLGGCTVSVGKSTQNPQGESYHAFSCGGGVEPPEYIYYIDNDLTPIGFNNYSGTTNINDLAYKDDKLYALQGNGTIRIYDRTLTETDRVHLPDYNETGTLGTWWSITEWGDDNFILERRTGSSSLGRVYYEVSNDFQLISRAEVDGLNTVRGLAKYNDSAIFKSGTTSNEIFIYNVTGTLVGDFLQNYSTNYCVSNTEFCNTTVHNLQPDGTVDSYCQTTPTFCPTEGNTGGCLNEEISGVITGSCQEVSCSSTCNYIGQNTCVGLSSYTLCGDFDADVCLETSSVQVCDAGEYCISGGCVATNLSSNFQTSRTVDLTASSTNAYEIRFDANSNTYYLKSLFETATVTFDVNGLPTAPDYTSSISDYAEVQNDFDDLSTTPSSNGWTGTGLVTGSDTRGQYVTLEGSGYLEKTLDTKINNREVQYEWGVDSTFDQEMHIQVLDESNNIISELKYDYDSATGLLSLSRSLNGTETVFLINDTGSGSNDLETVYTDVYILDEIDTLYYQIKVNRLISGETITSTYYSVPFNYTETVTGHATKVRFNNDNIRDSRVYTVVDDTLPFFNSYNSKTEALGQETLTYTDTGCFDARVYGNDFSIPTYHFFEEVTVCVIELSGVTDQTALEDETTTFQGDALERIVGQEFGDNTKTTIAIFTIFIILGVGVFIYTESKSNFILVASVIVSGLFLFWFTILGYLPVWLLIMLGVIGAGIVVRAGVNTFAR